MATTKTQLNVKKLVPIVAKLDNENDHEAAVALTMLRQQAKKASLRVLDLLQDGGFLTQLYRDHQPVGMRNPVVVEAEHRELETLRAKHEALTTEVITLRQRCQEHEAWGQELEGHVTLLLARMRVIEDGGRYTTVHRRWFKLCHALHRTIMLAGAFLAGHWLVMLLARTAMALRLEDLGAILGGAAAMTLMWRYPYRLAFLPFLCALSSITAGVLLGHQAAWFFLEHDDAYYFWYEGVMQLAGIGGMGGLLLLYQYAAQKVGLWGR